MNHEGKFWAALWAMFLITLCVIISLSTNYWKDHNTKIVELIKAGVPPVEAICAMQDDYGKHPTCIIIATQQK